MNEAPAVSHILSVDIGGSHIKAAIIDPAGTFQKDYESVKTPKHPDPVKVVETIQQLVKNFPPYEKVSVGFPGYIDHGIVITAPNLGTEQWYGVNLRKKLEEALSRPVKVVNDADMQGLGLIHAKGREMVITLGTGFGTAFFYGGVLQPHLELGQHPFTSKNTYDTYIGDRALEKEGEEKWNKRLKRVIAVLQTVFNYDHLFISGGNADKISFDLDKNITLVTNKDGIKGGARLWETADVPHEEPALRAL